MEYNHVSDIPRVQAYMHQSDSLPRKRTPLVQTVSIIQDRKQCLVADLGALWTIPPLVLSRAVSIWEMRVQREEKVGRSVQTSEIQSILIIDLVPCRRYGDHAGLTVVMHTTLSDGERARRSWNPNEETPPR